MKSLTTIVILLAIAICQTVKADWRDGKGVVFFDSDEKKIIYKDNLYPIESDDYMGSKANHSFSKFLYNRLWKSAHLDKDFSPNGAMPEVDYSIYGGRVTVDHESNDFPTFFSRPQHNSARRGYI